MAADIAPMLARLASDVPGDEQNWAFEYKWDGYRAVVYVEGGLRVMSRGGQDYTRRFPELRGLAALGRRVVLDGEVIAVGGAGGSSFQRLQQRSASGSDAEIARRAVAIPVGYMIFDLLRLDGRLTLSRPYVDRRARLESLGLDGPAWSVPPYQVGNGRAMLQQARQLQLEGVVAKRLQSRYVPGARTGDWLKIKLRNRQEFVIIGWTEGEGVRAGQVGALLVGYYDRPGGKLLYAGKVGTGFTTPTLQVLGEKLARLERATSPTEDRRVPRRAHFVEPRLVCEVEFTEWTRDGTLRHPAFKGLRDDKDPHEVVREEAAGASA